MSASATLALSRVTSIENLQQQQTPSSIYYQSSSGNNNNNNNNISFTSSAYEQYSPVVDAAGADAQTFLPKQTISYSSSYTALSTAASNSTADALLLEKMSASASACITSTATQSPPVSLLHKSHSYSGHCSQIKPKSTILKQDSLNGRIATSLTDSDSGEYGTASMGNGTGNNSALGGCCSSPAASAADGDDEHDAFLIYTASGAASAATGGGGGSNTSSRRGTIRSHGKSRTSFCYRAHAFISRNWYLSYLVPLSILLALMFVAYLTRDYAKRLLYWIETQNPWVIFALFMVLFVIVSFPVVVGYFVLMITAGYLFGCWRGFLTVILGANVGIAIAHVTIRSFRHRIPMHKLIKNETGRAILRVISGPRAFKVVLFTRLTPIPFGIQNAIFGVSSINPRVYHTATFLGLLPAQTINVYLGSTLRSMHEVLNNHGTAVTGYISFGVEVICGVALMFWVVQKARKELSETLLSDISTEGKLIDIQV